jgi:hypothetical protein
VWIDIMSEPAAAYRFFSWFRQGLLAGIANSGSTAPVANGHLVLPIRLRVNDASDVDVPIQLHGPGDVTGLDSREVIRTDPQQSMTDFEPNYFPLLEFDRPDFPWLFTPAMPDTSNRLIPWICLIVVRKDATTLSTDRNQPLPVLECPKQELPNLEHAWAWAHTQVVSSSANIPDPPQHAALKQILAHHPERTLSRLLAARRLDPNTAYVACLVPTYDIGRKIGLGETITSAEEQALQPAWNLGAAGSDTVKLPMYFHWEFRTGAAGDFESLARRLEPKRLPPAVGLRPLDISAPGWGMPKLRPGALGAALELGGALRAPDTEAAEWPGEARKSFQTTLRNILNFPAAHVAPEEAEALNASMRAELQVRVRRLAELRLLVAQTPAIKTELAAAERFLQGLDRRIARHETKEPTTTTDGEGVTTPNKEWKVWNRYHKRLIGQQTKASAIIEAHRRHLRELEQLQQEIPALEAAQRAAEQADAVLGPPLYGQWYARQQKIPEDADPPHWFRELNLDPRLRVAAGLGTLVIRFEQEQLMASAWDQLASQEQDNARLRRAQLAETVGDALLNKHVAPLPPHRLLQVTAPVHAAINRMSGQRGFSNQQSPLPANDPMLSAVYRRISRLRGPLARRLERIRGNGVDLGVSNTADWPRVTGASNLPAVVTTPSRSLDHTTTYLRTLKMRVLAHLDSKAAVLTAVRKDLPATQSTELIRFAPEFPQPMYELVRDYFHEMLLPGMEQVPPNTIALLETSQPFIEAYMVGLNHEMSRELLWRGYPTDLRGTYFRQFWDIRGSAQSLEQQQRERLKDIAAIAGWADESHLGEHGGSGSTRGQMVLLIRGDLLRRYPRALVYAVEAVWSADNTRRNLGTTELYPKFRATQGQDITMLGFPLTEQEVRGADDSSGHPGWFFVLQEQPTEPRFGMDVGTTFGGVPQHWQDLSWGHLAESEAALKQMVYVPIDGLLKDAVADNTAWGKNSAHMAAITRQRPFRVAIHARTWVSPRQQEQ